jgi:hypothetical protein
MGYAQAVRVLEDGLPHLDLAFLQLCLALSPAFGFDLFDILNYFFLFILEVLGKQQKI